MILIADSGSTKTDWVLLDTTSKQKTLFEGIGLNPYLVDVLTVSDEAFRIFNSLETGLIKHIYFYGSGCSTTENKQIIRKGLQMLFQHASVDVYHDMEGAAKALCENQEGIACILGTGSNACYYDGNLIKKSAVSLGYLLGDEGSGNDMGKRLIKAVYLNKAPEEIEKKFHEEFSLSLGDMLKEIYNKPYPNRFLASFTHFIGANRAHPFVSSLIRESFTDFLQQFVYPLLAKPELPVHFTGSVAWFFKDELVSVMKKHRLNPGQIIQKPIDGLINYYLMHE